jgi:hypothetical protein
MLIEWVTDDKRIHVTLAMVAALGVDTAKICP